MATTRGPRGKRGLRGKAGAVGARGAKGRSGPAGPKMKRSEVLEMVQGQFEWIRGQLDMQIRRIVELQVQLDQIQKLLKSHLAQEL